MGRRRYLQLIGLGAMGLTAGCAEINNPAAGSLADSKPSEHATAAPGGPMETDNFSPQNALSEDFILRGSPIGSKQSSSFGESAALIGETLLIGRTTPSPGEVLVFDRMDEEWAKVGELKPDDSSEHPLFGRSVGFDGNRGIIGAEADEEPNGSNSGSAYVYKRVGEDWITETKLVASDGDNSDQFGGAVAIDGDTAVVGAKGYARSNISGGGAVYVFERNEEEWQEQVRLLGDGLTEEIFQFGASVSIDGDSIAAGAWFGEDSAANRGGWVLIYTRSGSEWRLQAKLRADDGDSGDRFGAAVSLEGDTLLVGAPADEDPHGTGHGSAYIFSREDGRWTQQAKLVSAACEEGFYDGNDGFGTTVALAGERAVIGAIRDEARNVEDPCTTDVITGGAYLFTQGDNGEWSEQARLLASDGEDGDSFGSSVGFNGSFTVVGAQGRGDAYIYEL